ncbi:uncharacterized protein LOC116615570 [Nematostella vectensis]|uniref:uncharacterized protein LOC116615570 n=1 Tax=Nematostella vectensis TaxID=45351 RepID=UPI0013901BDE|nr:uncharacterized protein LOC116615570 [Nematostella vectensis]
MKVEVAVFSALVLVANLAIEAESWMCSPYNCPRRRSKIAGVTREPSRTDYRLTACPDGKGLCLRRFRDIFRDDDSSEKIDGTSLQTRAQPSATDALTRRIEALRMDKDAMREIQTRLRIKSAADQIGE